MSRTPEVAAVKRSGRIQIRILYLFLALFMVFFAYTYLQKTKEIKGLAVQEAALQADNQQTSADNARVRAAIAWYRTPQYVEERARADLSYTMPGEIPVQVREVVAPRVVAVRAAPPAPQPTPAPTWQQWVDVFTR